MGRTSRSARALQSPPCGGIPSPTPTKRVPADCAHRDRSPRLQFLPIDGSGSIATKGQNRSLERFGKTSLWNHPHAEHNRSNERFVLCRRGLSRTPERSEFSGFPVVSRRCSPRTARIGRLPGGSLRALESPRGPGGPPHAVASQVPDRKVRYDNKCKLARLSRLFSSAGSADPTAQTTE